MRYALNLTANVPLRQPFRGRCVALMSIGVASEVNLTLFGASQQDQEVFGDVGANFSVYSPDYAFSGAEIVSDVDTTVEILVTPYRVETLDGANLTVTTTRGGAPGTPLYVSGLTLDQTPAGSIVDDAAVAVTDVGAALVAADATRLEVRFANIGASPCALGTVGITWAKRVIVLQPGDVWIETKAAALAWRGITDTGLTASITMQRLMA